jgi:glutamate-1-semialdehyde aminotransferase
MNAVLLFSPPTVTTTGGNFGRRFHLERELAVAITAFDQEYARVAAVQSGSEAVRADALDLAVSIGGNDLDSV